MLLSTRPLVQRVSACILWSNQSTSVILFIFLRSHTQLEPSFFLTMTMGDALGNVDGLTTPISNNKACNVLVCHLSASSVLNQ